MKPLSPDKRAGLSVTGLLLIVFAIGLGFASYRTNGVPTWPMPSDELALVAVSATAAIIGFGCIMKGTEPSSNLRK